MASDLPSNLSRRGALKCLAFGGVGTVLVRNRRPATVPDLGR
jgi:hypothetical protein